MTDLRLTIIGCSAATPRPGGACASYLLTSGTLNVLLDCGPDSLSILRQEINPRNLDAIVISHLHADHTLDLVPLAYGLKYGPPEGDERKSPEARLPLFVPPGGTVFLMTLAVALEGDGGDGSGFWSPFDIREYDPDGTLVVGGTADYLNFRFAPTKHYIPCWAIKVFPPGEHPRPVLVYGADSAPVESLTRFAHGADFLILEATLPKPEMPVPVGHMTPRQAGELAQAAGEVKHLLLTHYWGNIPPEEMIAAAQGAFRGPVNVAKERDRYDITSKA